MKSLWNKKWRQTVETIGLVLVGFTFTACSLLLRDTPTPIPTQMAHVSDAGPSSTLVVFLPGRRSSMADFERNGILATLREAGVKADTVTVDAHLGYYYKRTVIERLWVDVLQPARQQGYRRIVLVGVSLGGVGALLCEREHPGAADALVLLSPYLGDDARLFTQIASAGGPKRWAVGRNLYTGSVEEELWTFLGMRAETLPPAWLLYGQSDSLGQGHRLLGTLLPATRVTAIAGAHDWPTWRALWRGVCFDSELFLAEKKGEISRSP